MRTKRWLQAACGFLLLTLVSLLAPAVPVISAGAIQSLNNGTWNDTATWQGGVVPGLNDDVEITHTVTLANNASVKNIKFNNQGKVNLGIRKLAVFGDLVDNTPTESAPVFTNSSSGWLAFEGNVEQQIKTETSKTLETRIQAGVEIKQTLKMKKQVCLMEQVKLADKGLNQGLIDIDSQTLIIKKDLVDDSTSENVIIDSSSEGPGTVSLEGSAEQKIKSLNSTKDEIAIDAEIEIKQRVKLEKNVRFKKGVGLSDKDAGSKGSIDIAGMNLTFEDFLSDDSSAPEAVKNTQSTGKVSFEGSWLNFITSTTKTAETVIQAQIEAVQQIDLLKDVRLKEKLRLADKDGNQGKVNIGGHRLSVEKDLVDDSSAAEAITNSDPGSGRISFEGRAEQKIKSEIGKTQATKIKAEMEIKQKVKLEKDVRAQEHVKLSDKDTINKGYVDLAGKNFSMEKDLVDSGSAARAFINSKPGSGKISFDGVDEQKIRSDVGKTQKTIIDCQTEIRKPSDKLVVAKETSMTSASFGASGLSDDQEVELQGKSTIHVDQTEQAVNIKQTVSSGSQITSEISSTLSSISLGSNNKVKIKKGSLIVEVLESDPVTITFAGITVTIPLNTKVQIEEPEPNSFIISNISDTGVHPDAGNIIVTKSGDIVLLTPGEESPTIKGISRYYAAGGQVEPVDRDGVVIPVILLALLSGALLTGLGFLKKRRSI